MPLLAEAPLCPDAGDRGDSDEKQEAQRRYERDRIPGRNGALAVRRAAIQPPSRKTRDDHRRGDDQGEWSEQSGRQQPHQDKDAKVHDGAGERDSGRLGAAALA